VDERTQQLTVAITQLEQSYDDTPGSARSALGLEGCSKQEGHCQRVTAFTISIAKAVSGAGFPTCRCWRGPLFSRHWKNGGSRSYSSQTGPLDNRRKSDHAYPLRNRRYKHMLTKIPFLRDAAEIVLAHQEFFDGTGYPRGLRGEQIPLGALEIFLLPTAMDANDQRPPRVPPKAPCRSSARHAAAKSIRRCAGISV